MTIGDKPNSKPNRRSNPVKPNTGCTSQSPADLTAFNTKNGAPMHIRSCLTPGRSPKRATTPNLLRAACRRLWLWCNRTTSRILKLSHFCGHHRRTMAQKQNLVLSVPMNQRSQRQSAKLVSCRWHSSSSTGLLEQGEISLDWSLL